MGEVTARRSNLSVLKEISPEYSLERLVLKLNTLTTWYEELTHWKRPWCWERLKAGGEGGNRGWDGWMASPTQWTWVWVGSRSWWWRGSLLCWSPWGRKESDTTEWLKIYRGEWDRGVAANRYRVFRHRVSFLEWWKYYDGIK